MIASHVMICVLRQTRSTLIRHASTILYRLHGVSMMHKMVEVAQMLVPFFILYEIISDHDSRDFVVRIGMLDNLVRILYHNAYATALALTGLEETRILVVLGGGDSRPVREDHIDRRQHINSIPRIGRQIAASSTEREPTNSDGRPATGHR